MLCKNTAEHNLFHSSSTKMTHVCPLVWRRQFTDILEPSLKYTLYSHVTAGASHLGGPTSLSTTTVQEGVTASQQTFSAST